MRSSVFYIAQQQQSLLRGAFLKSDFWLQRESNWLITRKSRRQGLTQHRQSRRRRRKRWCKQAAAHPWSSKDVQGGRRTTTWPITARSFHLSAPQCVDVYVYVYVCVRVRIYLREYNPFAFDVPSDGKCPLFFFSLVLFRLPILLFDYLGRLILKKRRRRPLVSFGAIFPLRRHSFRRYPRSITLTNANLNKPNDLVGIETPSSRTVDRDRSL